MLKSLFLVASCIMFLPMLASISPGKHSAVSGPAVIAFAGHATAGGEARTCGCPGYICDPDESPGCARTSAASGQSEDKTPGGKTPTSEADYGTAALSWRWRCWSGRGCVHSQRDGRYKTKAHDFN
ncbi:MAG TPA: hypothetical protein VJ464_11675 [Blastocatellia bacterium]|nr:hypothetical protein [Blastocatellia bacterium]